MKSCMTLFLVLLFPIGAEDLEQFKNANELYAKGAFSKALEVYQSMDSTSAEVFYNMGNTLMRLDRIPEAIAHYRRAQWLKPGDADLKANLNRASTIQGVPSPSLPTSRTLTGWFSPRSWQTLLLISCWLFGGCACATTLFSRATPYRIWILSPMAVLLLLSALGFWASHPYHFLREAIVKSQAMTRFEPLPDATAKQSLKGGAL